MRQASVDVPHASTHDGKQQREGRQEGGQEGRKAGRQELSGKEQDEKRRGRNQKRGQFAFATLEAKSAQVGVGPM